MNIIVLASVALPAVSAALTWIKGGDMCGGIEEACSDMESCTTVVYGPCLGEAMKPDVYLQGLVKGMAFVDEAKYLGCADPLDCADMLVIAGTGPGFRDVSAEVAMGDSKYAYTMVGNSFGDLATAGGYVGVASYIVTGATDIKTNMNVVYVANSDAMTQTTRSDSTFGAPLGPFEVCISDVADGKCGADIAFSPGQYKFSIFGYTQGEMFTEGTMAGQNGFPAAQSHLGIRVALSLVGATADSVMLNGDKTLATIGNMDVSKVTLGIDGGKAVTINFPTKYNIGTVGENGANPASATKMIKIKVSKMSASAIYIDYLFDLTDLKAKDQYFIYDPTMSVGAAGASTGTDSCPEGGTVWNTIAATDSLPDATCGSRITYVMKVETEDTARQRVAGEFPSICGSCDSSTSDEDTKSTGADADTDSSTADEDTDSTGAGADTGGQAEVSPAGRVLAFSGSSSALMGVFALAVLAF